MSPKLLELSGVGDGALLQRLGIPVVHHSPLVGENMRDHVTFSMPHRLVGAKGLNRRYRGIGRLPDLVTYLVARKGPMTLGPYEVGAFSRSDEEQDRPDIQVYFSAYSRAPGRVTTERAPGFTIATHIVQTSSIGSVHVSSADPAVASTISPNYLHHDADRRRAVAAVRFLRALIRQPAFARYVGDEIAPGARVESDDAIVDAVLRRLSGGTHALGTCAMGREHDAVLDGHLRVRGVRGTAGHRLLGDARPGVGEHQRTGHGAGLAGLRSHRRGAPLTTRRRATRFVPTRVPPAAIDLTGRDHPRGRRPDGPLTPARVLEAGTPAASGGQHP